MKHKAPMGSGATKGTVIRGAKPREWFFKENGGEQVARRCEVAAFVGWYHEHHVAPHLGLAGVFRRLWWRISGQQRRLLSPWELMELHAQRQAAAAEAEAAEEVSPAERNGRPHA